MVTTCAPTRSGPRTEWKFLTDPDTAAGVFEAARARMHADPFTHGPTHPGYRVESIYLDTPELTCFHRAGSAGLPKYRIRRYLPDSGAMFLEEKLRRGDQVWKRRIKTDASGLQALTNMAEASEPVRWYRTRIRILGMRPCLLIAYERLALQGPGGERLTIDRQLEATPLAGDDLRFGSSGPSRRFGAESVLEIKFDGPPTALAMHLRGLTAAEPTANSKYRAAVSAMGADRLAGAVT